ncbi:MAG: N-acetyltransferase family protein [Arenicellales bacterium]
MKIRAFTSADYPRVQAIYQQGIEGGHATFETKIKTWEAWDKASAKSARLVVTTQDEVVAWACLSDVSNRCVYEGVGETSLYIDNAFQGQGIGLKLLNALVEASEQAGYWTLQARIFPENIGSIIIHEKAGFEKFGIQKRLGKLQGQWRDVQLMERRSLIVGMD